MKITQIKVARARKIALRQYENTDVYVELTANVGEDEDPDKVFVDTMNKADEYLTLEVENVLESK